MRTVRFIYNNQELFGIFRHPIITILDAAPWLNGKETGETVSFENVQFLAPCKPNKIIGIAINYPGSTGGNVDFKEPLVFLKPSTSIIGDNAVINSPFKNTNVWGECELVIVIGKRLCKVNDEEARAGIFGYTIGNDVSADNVQEWDHHLARSKAADSFCVLGPWIDTEFEPNGKFIRGFHNDILLRQGILSDRLWAEPKLLVWLSQWMTLEPGDVILTGAPMRVRERIFLEAGDSYTCEIEGLGSIKNDFTND